MMTTRRKPKFRIRRVWPDARPPWATKLLKHVAEQLEMMHRTAELPEPSQIAAMLWYEEYEDYGRRPFRRGKEKTSKDGD
jgi:hypothetical protein